MDELSPVERLILYWISSYAPDGVSPIYLAHEGSDEVPHRHRLERDCFLAGEDFPPANLIEATSSLVGKGLLLARQEDFRADAKPLRADQIPRADEFTLIGVTEAGEEEARAFHELLQSQEGRRKSFVFANLYVERETAELSFHVLVPRYVPQRFDPVPDVVTYDEGEGVTLQYIETSKSGDDQIFIDETRAHLGDEQTECESESVRRDFISRVPATIRELQLTPQWVEIRIDWSLSGVSYRLSYHRSEGTAPDLDEDVEASPDADETISQWQGVDLPIDNEVQTAKIDDQMREECRRIAASLIEGA